MDPPRRRSDLDIAEVRTKLARTHDDLVQKVEDAASKVDAEYAFQALVTLQMLRLNEGEGYEESKHGTIPALIELAGFHLYPWFGKSSARGNSEIGAVIEALKELNDFRVMHTAFDVDPSDPELGALQVHLRIFSEMVRGSAYAPQIRRLIEKFQGPFEIWFLAKTGIGPIRALQVVGVVEDVVNENIRVHRERVRELQARAKGWSAQSPDGTKAEGGDATSQTDRRLVFAEEMLRVMEGMAAVTTCSFDQLQRHIPELTRAEWDGLRKLVGLTPESRVTLQHPREVRDRPMYFLSGERFVLLGQTVYDAMFDAYDRATRTDLPFRDSRYGPNLSAWMEEEVCAYLRRIFPKESVYGPVTYPDPDTGGEAEMDAAVVWGPLLVVAEVKGRQFRPRSRLGDPARLRDDLKENIEEAFQQANRAVRYINAGLTATFTEKGTGRKFVIRRDMVRRIFPISVTLHHFGGLTTQLALLKSIGLFRDSAYPWSVSLPDLDLITQFSGSPDIFLHYVQRRLDLQRSEKNVHGDELDLFGLYLDTRLHPDQFWDRKTEEGRDFTMLNLAGGSERFDKWFNAELFGRGEKPTIGLDLPPRFTAVLQRLRQGTDDGARWIAFAMLGLSWPAVQKFESDLGKLRESVPPAGKYLRSTFKDGDLVVSIVVGLGSTPEALHRQTTSRAVLEKYRLKGSASLALGMNALDKSEPYECAVWIEVPWKLDPEMEEQLRVERPKFVPGQRMPGRNDPCICGSGKKFKKCCMDKITIVPRDSLSG